MRQNEKIIIIKEEKKKKKEKVQGIQIVVFF